MDKCGTSRHCEAGRLVATGASINTLSLEYNSTTSKLSKNHKIIISEAKLRELSVDRCGTGKHCEAGRLGATEGQH